MSPSAALLWAQQDADLGPSGLLRLAQKSQEAARSGGGGECLEDPLPDSYSVQACASFCLIEPPSKLWVLKTALACVQFLQPLNRKQLLDAQTLQVTR